MSAKRAPMAPPDLPGFTYVDVLGSGGFADVYLYEQQLPKRRVAVKVLLTERMSSGSVAEFTAEANVMAMLSTHPAIVTIYQAGLAADGRPYLVMEYCPRPNLQARYRREPFSVAESLRVGVQVAAAVETAHRAGVLHRDIKPANILVTEYNRPALTDFGIASTTTAAAESAGLSIPWSPPESFADVPRSDPRSDVYALGATVYSLLSGRSPFEVPGQRNTAAELIQRIESMPLPAIGRADVPASLQAVLERSMAKSADGRYDTALAFARALQKVQIELSHSVTPIDILDDHVAEDVVDETIDGLTRVRGVVSINPETTPAAGLTRPSAVTAPVAPRVFPVADAATDETVIRGAAPAVTARTYTAPTEPFADTVLAGARPADAPAEVFFDQTMLRRPAPASTADAAAASGPAYVPAVEADPVDEPVRSRRGLVIGLSVAAAVLVIIGIVTAVSLPGLIAGPSPEASAPTESDPQDPVSVIVAPPAELAGTVSGAEVVFTWTNPDPHDGDKYLVGVVTQPGQDPAFDAVAEPTATVPANAAGQTCVEVMVVRANGQNSQTVTECVP